MRKQAGFTMIELVVVIVILGILAATALPRFINLTSDAEESALAGVVGAINSGNNINYATFLARGAGDSDVLDTTGGCTLSTAQSLMGDGSVTLSTKYTMDTAAAPLAANANTSCTLSLTSDSSITGTFSLTGAN